MITRFAPSPTGPLHLGHAYSALLNHDMAQRAGGTFLLRIEDIDQSRARQHWEDQIYDDLQWLGIFWKTPVMRQSERYAAYHQALQDLWTNDLLYPCTCTRADIKSATSAPQEGVLLRGADGLIYPGTCRKKPRPKDLPSNTHLRLDVTRAAQSISELSFTETGFGGGLHRKTTQQIAQSAGDFVVARQDMGKSYHLSVVIDDAAQNITDVVRGADIQDATYLHVLLQKLLNLPTPTYHHHRLIRDDHGKRLAKRDDARAIATYRDQGKTPTDIRAMVGL